MALSACRDLWGQLGAGAPFECKFGTFDNGPVVGVKAPGCRGAGHFTVPYFDQAPVKLCFGMTAEDYEAAGTSPLEDQLPLVERHAVPDVGGECLVRAIDGDGR